MLRDSSTAIVRATTCRKTSFSLSPKFLVTNRESIRLDRAKAHASDLWIRREWLELQVTRKQSSQLHQQFGLSVTALTSTLIGIDNSHSKFRRANVITVMQAIVIL